MHRAVEEEGLVERFRTLHQREPVAGADRMHAYARAFAIEEFDDEESPQERVDLAGLVEKNGPKV